MQILVTGGTGYIGSHTTIELIDAGHDVTIVDNLVNSKLSVLDAIENLSGKRPNFYEVDLCDQEKLEQVFKREKFDAVIHFAGLKAVGESVEKPLLYFRNNIVGTLNLLDSMKAHNVPNIIFSSSATVYGDQKVSKYSEEMNTGVGITNPYGWTKFMIEEILKSAVAAHEIKTATILRYFNPVGNHPSGLIGEDPNGIPNNLMPIIMQVARGERQKLTVFGNDYSTPDGTCIRDYIHVVDLAKGHLKALEAIDDNEGESTKKAKTDSFIDNVKIYNLGSGRGTSVLEMISAFESASGEKLPYEIGERRAGDLPEMVADPTKAERELNWKTELTVADAMRDTLKFIKS